MSKIFKIIRHLKRDGVPFEEEKSKDENTIKYPSAEDCKISVSSVRGERDYLYVLDMRNGLEAYTDTYKNVLKLIYNDTRWKK